jgi:hypothetical protein
MTKKNDIMSETAIKNIVLRQGVNMILLKNTKTAQLA